jgi:uncharacterized membrane protein
MAGYKERLTRDLDGWIASDLVPASSRSAILESVPDPKRADAASALAYMGVALLGLAVIAFVAANWNGIPRIGRYGLVSALFIVAAIGAARASASGAKTTANALLTFAALVFAADIGLTGQIFDLSGDPQTALYGAAAAAALLGLVGPSTGAVLVAVAFAGLGDLEATTWTNACVLVLAAVAAAGLAIRWRSAALAHGAGVALIFSAGELVQRLGDFTHLSTWTLSLAMTGVFVLLVLAARAVRSPLARIFYGWLTLGALVFLAAAGSDSRNAWTLAHRAVLIAASVGAILLGRRDRHAGVQVVGWYAFWAGAVLIGFETGIDDAYKNAWRFADRLLCLAGAGAMIGLGRHDRNNWLVGFGVLAMLASVSLIFSDLGLSLMAASGVFAVSAAIALVIGLGLRGRARA